MKADRAPTKPIKKLQQDSIDYVSGKIAHSDSKDIKHNLKK